MDRPSRSYDFLWLSIALLPLLGISFLFAIQPQDFWWLLRVGQDTIQNRAIPVIDTMSLSRFGSPVLYQPWLAGVLYWLTYQLGGISLIFLVRGILIGATYGLIWFMVRNELNPQMATILVVLTGLAGANNWSVRSQLFVYPLFIVCLLALLHWQRGNDRFLWGLPVSTFLWANLHGSFILPLVLAGAALIFGTGNKKRLLVVFGLMVIATLMNPRGLGVWQYFLLILNSPSVQLFVFEWAPPRNEGWQMNIFFLWLLIFAPLAAFSSRKPSLLEWIWFLGFGWMAITSTRYIIWFLFLAAILTASMVSGWVRKKGMPVRNFPAINLLFGSLILGICLLFLPGVREKWMPNSAPVYEMETTPIKATEWLIQHPEITGPLWADYAFSTYHDFFLQSYKPWMDARFHDYPPEQWDEYVQVSRAEGWREMLDREGINLLMLSTAAQPKLIEAVSSSSSWCGKYRDGYAVIFVRCEPRP